MVPYQIDHLLKLENKVMMWKGTIANQLYEITFYIHKTGTFAGPYG